MTWATVADMLERFNREDNPELDQLTAAPDDPADQDMIQAALDEAAAMIDGYVAGQALSDADNANLRRIQCNMARWTLYRDKAPERVEQLYKADMEQLRAISKREIGIGESLAASGQAHIGAMSAGLFTSRGF